MFMPNSPTSLSNDSPGQSQAWHVTRIYAVLAFLSFIIFGALHIFVEKTQLVGYLEMSGGMAVALIMLGAQLGARLTIIRISLLSVVTALLVVMLVTGGTQGTGIFWFFMFPVMAFFLAGAREGVYWMLLLFAVVAATWFAGKAGSIPIYYQDIEVRQLAVTLTVVTIGIFAYERYKEKSEGEAHHSRQRLQANMSQTEALHVKMDKAKGEFVALASHQLRTPISAIKWSSEMLLNGDAGKLTEDQRDIVQGIEDSNKRLGAIVDTMLLASSLDLGKLEVRVEPVDLPALSHAVLEEQLKKMPDKHFGITESYDSKMPKIRLDERIMSIILQNIFSNSIKYTPNDGEIAIAVRHNEEKLNADSRGSVLIEVADNGYGIPRDQQKDVFAKMFRAANAKAKDTDGTGLGLYTVKALLERVGGKIWFESEEDKGTTFFVLIPQEGMEKKEAGLAGESHV